MMTATKHLLAIDWGTSSLRAALMSPQGTILHRLSSADGIMFVQERSFNEIFQQHFSDWINTYPDSVALASGMIGSRQGWIEAPYVPCPLEFEDLGGKVEWCDTSLKARLGIVPGVRTDDANMPDVMRGEEMQVFGALSVLGKQEGVFVLPGTHSKWVRVIGGKIVGFSTYMTGELFAILRKHSILGKLMPQAENLPMHEQTFRAACEASKADTYGALLHRLFSTRTLGLFEKLQAEHLPSHLSGLLLAEEIREAVHAMGEPPTHVYLICNSALASAYALALNSFGIDTAVLDDEVTFAGLHVLAQSSGLLR